MDSPLLATLILVVLGFFALLAESQAILNLAPPPPPPPPPPTPPPLSPPPPLTPLVSPPPPLAMAMPPPPRILWVETPPPEKIVSPLNPPPPPHNKPLRPSLHTYHKHKTPPRSPPSEEKLNLGKKVGLLFTGIVAILQVCVVAFLVIKSRQMFKDQDVHS